ncbi:MAG: hypothetical protein A4S09_16710 [Proteobacteria bacterium SG_bin7]|nr:MAG: hypothetical protein A4S09_16710 [Proteobacteria bacterium SG_bin7]
MIRFLSKFLVLLFAVTSHARPLTELEVQVIKTQVCRNNDDSILRSLSITDLAPQPQCKYEFIYCRTGHSRTLNRVSGDHILVADCNIKGALRQAIDNLWNSRQCGGILSDKCIKPADCYGVDRNRFESSLGSYTMPDEANRF